MFLEDYSAKLALVEQAIARGDAAGLARSAHGIKGLLGNFTTGGLLASAQTLEKIGRNDELSSPDQRRATEEVFSALKTGIEQLALNLIQLTAHRTEDSATSPVEPDTLRTTQGTHLPQ